MKLSNQEVYAIERWLTLDEKKKGQWCPFTTGDACEICIRTFEIERHQCPCIVHSVEHTIKGFKQILNRGWY